MASKEKTHNVALTENELRVLERVLEYEDVVDIAQGELGVHQDDIEGICDELYKKVGDALTEVPWEG